jgi:hypothetical protein
MTMTRLTDDLDLNGHHLRDWRYLSDMPQSGALTGQALMWDGTAWAPATIPSTGGTGLVSSVFGRIGDVMATNVDYAGIVGWEAFSLAIADGATFGNDVYVTSPTYLASVHIGADTDRRANLYMAGFSFQLVFPDARIVLDATLDLTAGLRVDSVVESTTDSGVSIEGVLLKDSVVNTDTINELNTDTGVTIDGMLVKDSQPYADVINEMTGAAGVTVDGVKLKDAQVYTDVVNEATAAAGVTLDGVKLKDSEVYTDVVREKTAAAGVTVDGVLLKDNGVTSTWSTVGAPKTNVSAAQTLTTSGMDFAAAYASYASTMALTAAAGTMTLGTLKSYDSNITLTNGTPTLFSMGVHPFASTLNAGGVLVTYTGSAAPVHFIFTNPNAAQAFADGYLSVDVAGTTGDVIAALTRARASGAANGVGYRGYAIDASGSTGTITGVNGMVVMSAGSTSTAVMSFDARIDGTAVAYDKRMSFRGSNHMLVRGGSLILATGTPATPNAVTTTHLTLTAGNSDLFVGGKAEIDGETFMDGNTSISVATTTSASYTAAAATVILANANSAAITVNLPAASGKTGRIYTIKKTDASANTVTVDGNAAETIDGATTKVLTTQYEVVRIVCDGTNWHII